MGPGRGSGAGSLVAYWLGITDLDPLRYDLLFERFLNPERVSMPDFDIDFCQDGRDRVIDYVKQKYGAEAVSQIATFGTMAAKAVMRDVGRVLELPTPHRRHRQADSVPAGQADHAAMARERSRSSRSARKTRRKRASCSRSPGARRPDAQHRHARRRRVDRAWQAHRLLPAVPAPGAESVVSQFDKDDVEAVGLVKFDFLGLTTLTILDWTMRYIRSRARRPRPKPPGDAAARRGRYKIFATANTTAVFQFESRGMRDLLVQARPDRFEDIIALVALYGRDRWSLSPTTSSASRAGSASSTSIRGCEPSSGPPTG